MQNNSSLLGIAMGMVVNSPTKCDENRMFTPGDDSF